MLKQSYLEHNFRFVRNVANSQWWYRGINKLTGLKVIISSGIEQDGKEWIHLSVSRADRLPTWDELETKEAFIGLEAEAIQVIPRRSKHINIHPYCLHLFFCPESGLPDFTRGSGSL